LHVGDGFVELPGVGDPLIQEPSLFLGDADGDRLAFHFSRPFVIGAVQLGWISLATTALFPARDEPTQDGAAPEWAKVGQGCLQPHESVLVPCSHGSQCNIFLDYQYIYW
jgi:hypothetical protein